MTRPALVEALLDPTAYPERPDRVELGETHISWLFFTGQFVYKVKKPVDFGFLDFTSLEKRRHFCQEEVRLNQRLSPRVYLGVVEIRQSNSRYRVEGPGQTVEFAVKMRQLPRERVMAALLQRGEVTAEMVRQVASLVADFHRRAATGPEITHAGGFEAARFNVQENFTQTEPYIRRTISRETYDLVRAYSEAFLEAKEPLFRQREAQGRVRDGHGDLHTAQIFFDDGVQVIDCIEFTERFRYGDVAGDGAFLAMDLDFHGRPDLATAFMETYVESSGDEGVRGLLDFFKCYRAYVRGKVEGFRLEEPGLTPEQREAITQRAARYFALAASYARPFKGASLLITTGLMGTGKSTLAQDLATRLGARVLSSDVVRKQLAGVAPTERRYEPWGQGIYAEGLSEHLYQELLSHARPLLQQGEVVLLDASYRKRSWREAALALAQELGIPFFALECVCPEPVVQQRLALRQKRSEGPSDGRLELLGRQKEAFEPITELPAEAHLVVDTARERQKAAFDALKALCKRTLERVF